VVSRSDLINRPWHSNPNPLRQHCTSGTARVSLRLFKNGRGELNVFLPMAFVADVFGEKDCFDLAVFEEDSRLRWALFKPNDQRKYPTVRIQARRYRLAKAMRSEHIAAALGHFQLASFSVCPAIRVEDVEGEPGRKVLVLEMDEALQGVLKAAADTTASVSDRGGHESQSEAPQETDGQLSMAQPCHTGAPSTL
jgi:hypothetical protein